VREIFLVRHAKSGWDDAEQPDALRTLNERGKRDAPVMAARFASKFSLPERWLSSPAVRAKQTADYFAQAFALPTSHIKLEPILYSFDLRKVLTLVASAPTEINSVVYFFHNPTIAETLHYLTGEIRDVATCAVAHIQFDVSDWQHVSKSSGSLTHFDYPKNGD
jgi:phosphohistidine phosphatase